MKLLNKSKLTVEEKLLQLVISILEIKLIKN
jgi:hypothetical protein